MAGAAEKNGAAGEKLRSTALLFGASCRLLRLRTVGFFKFSHSLIS